VRLNVKLLNKGPYAFYEKATFGPWGSVAEDGTWLPPPDGPWSQADAPLSGHAMLHTTAGELRAATEPRCAALDNAVRLLHYRNGEPMACWDGPAGSERLAGSPTCPLADFAAGCMELCYDYLTKHFPRRGEARRRREAAEMWAQGAEDEDGTRVFDGCQIHVVLAVDRSSEQPRLLGFLKFLETKQEQGWQRCVPR
jgi:hypothetical protein